MQKLATAKRQNPTEPWELEADLGCPGSPREISVPGGRTVRRLLGAYKRQALWRDWATNSRLTQSIYQILNDGDIYLSQAHHNCLMTKSPEYSSDTGASCRIRCG